ncbi:MAG: metallophosphoesterase, partial [Planctomycetota bacterium]
MMRPMSGDGRTLILSDTHLAEPGRGAGSAAALRPLWAGFDRVVFNGDTAETRSPRHRDASHRAVDEIGRMTAEDGVALTVVAGNHDPFVSEIDWVELAGGAVLATHGDLLHPAVAPWADESHRLAEAADAALAELGEDRSSADARQLAEAAKRASARHWRREVQGGYERRSAGVWG